MQHLQTLGNLKGLLLQYVLAHIKKDLSKISSTANQRKSMQFFAVLEHNLFCQFFLLNIVFLNEGRTLCEFAVPTRKHYIIL